MSALDSLPANATLIWLMNPSENPLRIQEGFDLALAMSAMGQDIVLLCDLSALAVFRPSYKAPGVRDLSKNIKALSLYGIEYIFAHMAINETTLKEDAFNPPDNAHLAGNVQMLNNKQVQRLIVQSRRTLTF